MADKKPLWRVMQDAFTDATVMHGYGRDGYAAELRAIADVVVPEEPEPLISERHHLEPGVIAEWAERQRIRALLLAEAERAERGNDVQRHLDDFQNRHAADFQALARGGGSDV
jgi:hypothetical protein